MGSPKIRGTLFWVLKNKDLLFRILGLFPGPCFSEFGEGLGTEEDVVLVGKALNPKQATGKAGNGSSLGHRMLNYRDLL